MTEANNHSNPAENKEPDDIIPELTQSLAYKALDFLESDGTMFWANVDKIGFKDDSFLRRGKERWMAELPPPKQDPNKTFEEWQKLATTQKPPIPAKATNQEHKVILLIVERNPDIFGPNPWSFGGF